MKYNALLFYVFIEYKICSVTVDLIIMHYQNKVFVHRLLRNKNEHDHNLYCQQLKSINTHNRIGRYHGQYTRIIICLQLVHRIVEIVLHDIRLKQATVLSILHTFLSDKISVKNIVLS